jgi:triacylglycerol esterase/lipase EstA (alpha/beta hydrolase family)
MVVDYGNEVGYGDKGPKFFDNDNNEDYPKRFRTSCPRALARGLEPNWSWSDKSPVHFVCHSQGGTSVRTLIELLSGRHQTQHPKFAGDRRNWVKSVVTLGTPHRGSTIIDVLKVYVPMTSFFLRYLS